jgi:hypothetical protein
MSDNVAKSNVMMDSVSSVEAGLSVLWEATRDDPIRVRVPNASAADIVSGAVGQILVCTQGRSRAGILRESMGKIRLTPVWSLVA